MIEDPLHIADGRLVSIRAAAEPFNSGEVEIELRRGVSDVVDVTDEELAELGKWISRVEEVLRAVYRPEGVNIGTVSGEGGTLTWRVVPRWAGDMNFMPVIGHVKVMPETPTQSAERIRNGFSKTAS